MAVYSFLVVSFYTFLGLFLGNRIAEITVTAIYSFVVMHHTEYVFAVSTSFSAQNQRRVHGSVFQALSVMFLFIRCTAIDPTDKTSFKKKKKAKSNGPPNFNYGFIMSQLVVRFFRRLERKILRTFIRRKYLDPLKTSAQMEPLLPFPLVLKDDSIAPDPKDDDISYCSLCDFEVGIP